MYYSVKELRNKLIEKVLGLGINPNFKENPAFSSALSLIDGTIACMNMFEAAEDVIAVEENGKISFEWTSLQKEKYHFEITFNNQNEFSCICIREKQSYCSEKTKRQIRGKSVEEIVVTLNNENYITVTHHNADIYNDSNKLEQCGNYSLAERKQYNSNGIMIEREYKSYSGFSIPISLDRLQINAILSIARNAFDMLNNGYTERTLLIREKLDTARIISENKLTGARYYATTPLNQEYGLRDMNLSGGYNQYPEDVEILPITEEELEAMIERESNPKVKMGLRQYTKNRTNYSYSSKEDPYFICEVPSKGPKKVKTNQ